jgi:hypothetical protein
VGENTPGSLSITWICRETRGGTLLALYSNTMRKMVASVQWEDAVAVLMAAAWAIAAAWICAA